MSFSQEKVMIIGAGIVGLMTALELIEHGYHVEIFDQTDAAKAASWAGGGILSPMYPWKYHPAVNQLAQFGKQSYLSWNQKVMPISGVDFEIEQVGMLIFDHDQFDRGLNYAHDFHKFVTSEKEKYQVILLSGIDGQFFKNFDDNYNHELMRVFCIKKALK